MHRIKKDKCIASKRHTKHTHIFTDAYAFTQTHMHAPRTHTHTQTHWARHKIGIV